MINPLLQSSLKMWHALRTTPKPHLFAEVIPALSTYPTLPAGDSDLQCHSVTDLEAIDLLTDSNYHARGFVAKRQRCAGT